MPPSLHSFKKASPDVTERANPSTDKEISYPEQSNKDLKMSEYNLFCQSDSSDDRFSTPSMTPEVSASSPGYERQLALAGIYSGDTIWDPPSNFKELCDSLGKDRDDPNVDEA